MYTQQTKLFNDDELEGVRKYSQQLKIAAKNLKDVKEYDPPMTQTQQYVLELERKEQYQLDKDY